eukprot:m.236888 g.236888  ORF g.236888 m.236888 type:complete len:377 (-) comp33693_c0_seq3:56-1186(-)
MSPKASWYRIGVEHIGTDCDRSAADLIHIVNCLHKDTKQNRHAKVRLLQIVWTLTKWNLLRAFLWSSLTSALTLVIPPIIFEFFKWFEDGDAEDTLGYALSGAVGGCYLCAGWTQYMSEKAALRTGLSVRTALCTLTFLKGQQLNLHHVISTYDDKPTPVNVGNGLKDDLFDLETSPLGEMSELMGKTASDVQNMFQGASILILRPIEILVAVGLMYDFVGYSALVTLLVLGVMIVIVQIIGKRITESTANQDLQRNKLITVFSESMSGIMTIRLSGWTSSFFDRITQIQQGVADYGRSASWFAASVNPLTNTSVDLISLGCSCCSCSSWANNLHPPILLRTGLSWRFYTGKFSSCPPTWLRSEWVCQPFVHLSCF